MNYLLTILFTITAVSAEANSLNINTHKSQLETSFPQGSGENCLVIGNLTEKRAKSLSQELEIYAGPGIQHDPSSKVVPYIYRLSPISDKTKLVFRGLQLPERNNPVRIQTGSNSSLAEVFENSGFGAEPVLLELSRSCK